MPIEVMADPDFTLPSEEPLMMGGKDMISDLWGFIVGGSGAAPLSTGVF